MTYDHGALVERLIRHEGLRLKPYQDTTGHLTIGVGRNLTDRGISKDEALYLLADDIAGAEEDLTDNLPWWAGLDPVRQAVLLELCFAMGWPVLSEFRETLGALERRDYAGAAGGLRTSLWARQVGQRAEELAAAIESGAFPA